MRRISAANTAPGNLFRDANPGAGQRATSFNAAWCNDVQETLLHPIELSGRTGDASPDQLFRAMVDLIYPVGRYIQDEGDDSPAVVYTWQTWVPVLGRVLVGLDESQAEFNEVGKQGGAKAVALSAAQLPNFALKVFLNSDGGANISDDPERSASFQKTGGSNSEYRMEGAVGTPTLGKTSSIGNDETHSNLQPYRVVRMWRRTA